MRLDREMSSADYHAERGHYSSSQLKDMIYSPELFYKKHVSREIAREENAVFDIGTYFHTAILEPHLLNKECAVYEGVRHGAKWEAFKEKNKGKAIITMGEKVKAMNCVNAIRSCPISMAYVNMGTPEVSAFLRLYVWMENIYYLKDDSAFKITYTGWKKCSIGEYENLKEGILLGEHVEVGVKVRADSIDLRGTTISDLKSSSGDVADDFKVRGKTSDYCYDLSAALYIDIFSAVIGVTYTDFVWLYASKDLHEKLKAPVGKPWRASADNILIGRSKWTYAILEIAHYISRNWDLGAKKAILADLEPKDHELLWLKKKHIEHEGEFKLSDLSDVIEQIEKDKERSLSKHHEEDMKIVNATYERTFKTADFEGEKIGFSATLEEGDTAEEVITELKKIVEENRTPVGASPASNKKDTKAKLEVTKDDKKADKAEKAEKKEEKKKEASFTKYEGNDKQRSAVGSLMDKIIPGWREKADVKAHAKKSAAEMDGENFMDADGNIVDTFVEKLKKKMSKFIETESEEGDDI